MEIEQPNTIRHSTDAFFCLVRHPFKLKLYLLKNLPSAFFSGLKVVQANEKECLVSVPYKWFTKNPFRSTYFACLSMAAELSTGVLAMAYVFGRKPSVSMLITGMESRFYRKAKGLTYFLCQDGNNISHAINTAITSGEAQDVKVFTRGTNSDGEVVAEFWFTWSFKVRQSV
ncbi:MAG TPA: DUF4442 domain-containing protein [Flavisolibacter sp.]|jgi:hypothetical protein|nr:DUF4442 domain-containing protein [Flavisolibacter sp.]